MLVLCRLQRVSDGQRLNVLVDVEHPEQAWERAEEAAVNRLDGWRGERTELVSNRPVDLDAR